MSYGLVHPRSSQGEKDYGREQVARTGTEGENPLIFVAPAGWFDQEMVAAILHSGLFILWVISWRREECAELTYTSIFTLEQLNAGQPSAIIRGLQNWEDAAVRCRC